MSWTQGLTNDTATDPTAARTRTIRDWLDQSAEFNWLPDGDRATLARAVAGQPHVEAFMATVAQVKAGQMPDKAPYVDLAMAIARDCDVAVPADKMVLFTSNRLDDVKAHLQQDPSLWTNHKTPAVAMLGLMETFNDQLSPLDWKDAYLPWRAVSLRYAQQAKGDVTVIADPNKDSTLWRVELPAILANDAVPTLSGQSKDSFPLSANKAPAQVESMADFDAQAGTVKATAPRVRALPG